MHTLESFSMAYETDQTPLSLRGRSFRFFVPRSIDPFVDPLDPLRNFPLWSKIWEASIVLADHLAEMAPTEGKAFLEIGGGLGVVGVVAASFGHQVTLTDCNPDALNFARANALLNLPPESYQRLTIAGLDWIQPNLEGYFDYVVASEVIYKEEDYAPLLRLFEACLKPGGEVILCEGLRMASLGFFQKAQETFLLRAYEKTLRSKEKEVKVILCRMWPRKPMYS